MTAIDRFLQFQEDLEIVAKANGFKLREPAGHAFWPTYKKNGFLDTAYAVEFEDLEGQEALRGRVPISNPHSA